MRGTTASRSESVALEITAVAHARRWWIVGLLSLASLINYLDRFTISIALPLISIDLHLGPAKKGMLLSAFFWSYALMQIPTGWCADRLNLRWLYAASFTLWSLAQGLTGLATGLGTLILFRILLGIGESIYLPGGTKAVSLLFASKERGLPSGTFDLGTRIGMVLGGLAIPSLLVRYGWRRTFMAVGFSALVWLVPWLLVCPARLSGKRLAGHATRAGQTLGQFLSVVGFSVLLLLFPIWIVLVRFLPPNIHESTGAGVIANLLRLTRPLRNRNLLGICLGFSCFDYYWYLLVTWLPDYLVTVRHLTILTAGLYASLPFLVFGVSEPVGGWVADHLISIGWDETRTRKGIVTVAFLTGLCLIPAARVASTTSAIALVVGGSLVGLASGNLLVILQSCAPPDEVGVWTGFENFAGNLSGVVAPIATGLLISRTGSFFAGFVLAAVVLTAGLLAYWFIVGELKYSS
jgi:MFS transporter, ACS family, D-galactonate transporter